MSVRILQSPPTGPTTLPGPQAGKIFAEHGHVVDVCLLTEEQRKKSSTLRELLGLIRMCMVHLLTWRGHCIRIFVDNAALAKIMIRGSRIPELHLLVRKLVDMLSRFNIRIKVIWIPRKQNRRSDTMSKKIELERLDREDYILNTAAFKYLSHCYGPFLVDMFANANNTKCVHFVRRHADNGSIPETIDAFYQPSWGSAFYASSPVDDAPCALVHILSQISVRGVLILPLWVRLSSFSVLFLDGNHFIPQVRGWSLLLNTDFSKGSYGHATFLSPSRGGHKTPFIAVLINTSHDASLEISDLPGRRFCLLAYYGQPSACVLCSHWLIPILGSLLYTNKRSIPFCLPLLFYTKTSQTITIICESWNTVI